MAAVVVDPKKVKSFRTQAAFEAWLAKHHESETELWLKIHKKDSGAPSVTQAEAIDAALCWGWIDGIRKAFDERSFLQRYSPRRERSVWSQINREHVARLTRAGRMQPAGQRLVEAAKANGRWEAAYGPMRALSADTLPADLRAAIAKNARAAKRLPTLDRPNLYSLAFRTHAMRTPSGRARKIAELVSLLARGASVAPSRPSPTPEKKPRKRR